MLNRALRDGRADQRFNALADVLKDYLSDRFNLPPGELTPTEAMTVLTEHGADDTTAGEVAEFLETCNAARYVPGAVGTMSADQAADNIRAWIKRIERTTR